MRILVRLVVVLLVLIALAVAADRLAARAVEQAVAERVQEAGALTSPPEVEVRGVPFLTQALRGEYDDVVARAHGVQAGPLRVDSLVAQLHGVQVPLRDVVQGEVHAVPVDELTARAVLTYPDLTAAVADRGLRVSPAGGGLVRVTGTVRLLGQTVEVSAVSRPTLEGDEIVITAERFEVGNGVADALATAALGGRLDFRLPLDALPYGLEVTALHAGADGVVLNARSSDAVLRAP